VTALIGERAEQESASADEISKGLEGADLADAPDGSGVLVKLVAEGSPAAQGGLRPNDVIFGVGRSSVTDLKSFREAAKGASLLVLKVRRGQDVILIPIR
jgi:S1-C subfamily serine protease